MVRPVTLLSRAAAATAVVGTLLMPLGTAHADDSLTVTTPYPAVETQPGSTVKFDITLVSATPDPVQLKVDGTEDGWTTTLRGGGFVVHEVTAEPDNGAKATLEVDVPPSAKPGNHDLTLVATDATGATRSLGLELVVAEQVDNGIALTADFPSLSGDPGGSFSYTLTVDNETPIEQTFTFDPSGPQGWTVTASPTAEAKAQTLTIEAGATSDLKVTATAPDSAEEGQYPIDISVVGANGASGTLTLEADVVGTPKLAISTADQRLDVTGPSNKEHRIPMIVSNTGTAELDSVKLAGTAPTGWDVSFDPQTVDAVQPGETAQVTAIVTPSSDAVAGDYAMTVRASAGSLSQNVDLRYTLEGSKTLGVIAVGVIALAFIALAGVFVKFGRR
jgi:uncharacterized membrane protein